VKMKTQCARAGRRVAWCVAGLLAAGRLFGADAYVLRFATPGPTIDSQTGSFWSDRITFHNGTSQPLTARILGVSNGGLRPGAADLTVDAGKTAAVSFYEPHSWVPPIPVPPLWVVHMDVPKGLAMESRVELSVVPENPFPELDYTVFGALPLPIVGGLIPAGQPQFFLGADLGSSGGGFAANARINAVVYNGGNTPGTITVETRRACDDDVIERRSVVVAPDSAVQVRDLSSDTTGCTTTSDVAGAYVVVTSDQPSASWVTTLSNDVLPIMPVGVSLTQ
jgi:hypothetical protein